MKTQNICHKVAEDQEDMLKLVSNHVPYLFASQLNSVPTFFKCNFNCPQLGISMYLFIVILLTTLLGRANKLIFFQISGKTHFLWLKS